MTMIDHHELVAAARHAREFNRLAAKYGADFIRDEQHRPDVKAFVAMPAAKGDMIARGYLLNEAAMMVAEARATKRGPETIAKATGFAESVAEMSMVEVQKWLRHFLDEKAA